MRAVLDVAHVSLQFGGIRALDDVSLAVEQAGLVAVVGPNGAGKTSLLNCITGAYRASSGHISFQGADIPHAPAHTAAKRGIARTFQNNELFPQLTTLENLLLGRQAALDYDLISAGLFLKRCRRWELEQREKVEAVIGFFELEAYREHSVGDLAYGVEEILGLARAFAAQPALVDLAAPFAGVDRPRYGVHSLY